MPELLRAFHIWSWALCNTDEQRLDVFNGLLLLPNLDALFDGGSLTFKPTGAITIAPAFPRAALELLSVAADSHVYGVRAEHLRYLEFQPQRVFRGTGASL